MSALRAGNVGVIVLDECHHLASMWGYVVRAVLDELGVEDVHVIGLTATPPSDLDRPRERAVRGAARAGRLHRPDARRGARRATSRPYQELAWLTEPLDSERAWLAEHDTRFKELVTALHDDAESPHSFPALGDHAPARAPARRPRTRPRCRGRSSSAAARRSRAPACASSPRPASALPDGAPRGEAYRRPPDLEDWLVLLEDYALRCLHPSAAPEAADRYAAVAAALGQLGFRLTRRGIRRGTSEVDRLLTGSQAKALGLVEVLAAEMESRGDALRALVLCDSELAEAKPDPLLGGVLDPAAGTRGTR